MLRRRAAERPPYRKVSPSDRLRDHPRHAGPPDPRPAPAGGVPRRYRPHLPGVQHPRGPAPLPAPRAQLVPRGDLPRLLRHREVRRGRDGGPGLQRVRERRPDRRRDRQLDRQGVPHRPPRRAGRQEPAAGRARTRRSPPPEESPPARPAAQPALQQETAGATLPAICPEPHVQVQKPPRCRLAAQHRRRDRSPRRPAAPFRVKTSPRRNLLHDRSYAPFRHREPA